MIRQLLPTLAGTLFMLSAQPLAHGQTRFFGIDNPRSSSAVSHAAESAFINNLGVRGTETFESLSSFQYLPSLSFGTTGVHAITTDSEPLGGSFVNDFSPLSSSSPKGLFTFARETTFTFDRPITGFGTYLIGAGGQGVDLTVDVLLQNTLLGTSRQVDVATFASDLDLYNSAYFGVIDRAQPFNRVTLRRSEFNSIELDSTTVGYALPDRGATMTMMAMGLGGLAIWKRRLAICIHG